MVVVIEIENHQELGSHLSPLKSGGPAVTPVCMKNLTRIFESRAPSLPL